VQTKVLLSSGVDILKHKNMNKVQTYFKDSYNELTEKVTWPNWQQLQQSTMIVLVATLIITAIVWVLDAGSNGVLKFIYSLFK
jgi:preprotein translocase subunit SecE